MGGSKVHGDREAAKRLQLIGNEPSLYTGKARAYMLWKGIPFEEVVITGQIHKKIIIPRVGWAVIPVLLDNDAGKAVQDTADIIDYLDTKFPETSALPPVSCSRQRTVCYIFELFSDQYLASTLGLHFRWSFPEQTHFIEHEFTRGDTALADPVQVPRIYESMRNGFMSQVRSWMPGTGVNEETIPFYERFYDQFLDAFEEHLTHHHYLLGGRPTLADFALMGVMYGHLYRDPVPHKIMRLRAPKVAEWVERCNHRTSHGGEHVHVLKNDNTLVLEPRNSDIFDNGELVPDDEIPATLFPLLRFFFEQYMPILLETERLLVEFLQDHNKDDEIPRSIGFIDFNLGDIKSSRAAMSFDIWKLQRVVDEIGRAKAGGEGDKLGSFLAQFGPLGRQLFELDLSKCRVKRVPGTRSQGNNLYLDETGKSSSAYMRPDQSKL